VAIEGVVDGVIGSYSEGNAIGWPGPGEGEASASGGSGRGVDRVEVEVDMAIEIIDVNTTVAIKFRDVKVWILGNEVLEGLNEGVKKGEDLCR